MTRTHYKHLRCYVDGYDMSGYTRQIGPLVWGFETGPDAAYSDECKNITPGKPEINPGTLSGFLDNDVAGLFALSSAARGTRNLMVAVGINAAPVAGVPVFAWQFEQQNFQVEPGSGFVAAALPFGGASYAGILTYNKPWGYLLAPKAARTAVNDQAGIDDYGAQTTRGGIFVYHLFSSDGTVTLKAQDASTNSDGNFGDLSGATSGAVDASSTPKHGMVALGTTATVKRYLRWQLAFGTATTATFAAAFIRG